LRNLFFVAFALFALLLAAGYASAFVPNDSMRIYAVTTEGTGLVATLNLQIEPGSGKIWTSVTPLVGTSTQNAEKVAVGVAKRLANGGERYDYKFTINSSASVVDGPSAGAAMALLAASMLTDRDLKDYVSITGTISEDGRVGPVGGVFEKAREAQKTGVKLFLIPKGEAMQTVRLEGGVRSINLLEYAPQQWGLKVAEVATLSEALQLAHSELGKIDINTSAGASIPEFVPQKLSLKGGLGPFKTLTTNYISETKIVISEARTALSSSLLEDPSATHALLEVLNSSEQTISKAEILNEQNYLYSAANFAYLARVNAIMVKEISTSPKLLGLNSSAFDMRLIDLKREIDNFENDLSGPVPREGIEWFAAAQQRYMYARRAVEKLFDEGRTVVVGGNAENEQEIAIAKVGDYAYAMAWLDVAKDFYNLSQESQTFVMRNGTIGQSATSSLYDANALLQSLNDGADKDDIARRVDSASALADMNWFEASYFDSLSAKALVQSENEAAGKDGNALAALLEGKIAKVEARLAASAAPAGWAQLYLDHAKYFLQASKYYDSKGLPSGSAENLKSGISLAFLADSVLDASAQAVKAYEGEKAVERMPEGGQTGNGKNTQDSGPVDNTLIFGMLVLLLGIVFVLAFLLIGAIYAKAPPAANAPSAILSQKKAGESGIAGANDLDQGKIRLNQLRQALATGTITKEEYIGKLGEYLDGIEKMRKDMEDEMRSALPKKGARYGMLKEAAQAKDPKYLPAVVKKPFLLGPAKRNLAKQAFARPRTIPGILQGTSGKEKALNTHQFTFDTMKKQQREKDKRAARGNKKEK